MVSKQKNEMEKCQRKAPVWFRKRNYIKPKDVELYNVSLEIKLMFTKMA